MRVLILGPNTHAQKLIITASELHWNATLVDDVDEAFAFMEWTDFQVIFVCVANGSKLELSSVQRLSAKHACVVVALYLNTSDARASALEAGAALHVSIPVSKREVKAAGQRAATLCKTPPAKSICTGNLEWNPLSGRLFAHQKEIDLAMMERSILELLFRKIDRTVTRDALMNHLYGNDDEPEPKIVDVFVCKLRKKLRMHGLPSDVIKTVWGEGYRLSETGPQIEPLQFRSRRQKKDQTVIIGHTAKVA